MKMHSKTAILFLLCLLRPSLSLDASGLTLSGADAELFLNQSAHPFKISLESDKLLFGNCIEYEESENVYLDLGSLHGSTSLEIDSKLSFDAVNQWALFHIEDFSKPTCWSDNRNSKCGNLVMLGGYCVFSDTEVSKTFQELPPHSAVKIVASFHFIDAWIGETAYLKVSLEGEYQYVWTENYKAGQAGVGIDACGEHHTEGKFASLIEVMMPHTESSLRVTFGATLDEDPCDESWGVSMFQIFVR